MKFKIINIVEERGQLRVTVDHDFGTDNLGFSLDKKKLDPHTDEPKFLSKVKQLLEKKYGDKTRKPKNVFTKFVGKEYDS